MKKYKISKLLVFALVFVLTLSCSTGNVMANAPAHISLSAITGVTPPVTGAIPVTKATDTDEYTTEVSWNGNPEIFTAGTVYTATIAIIPIGYRTLKYVDGSLVTVAGATNSPNFTYPQSGIYPKGSLILSGGKFYGTTSAGGADNAGSVFEWDPTTSTITKQSYFDVTNGNYPLGSLILSGGKFYGTTYFGGLHGGGVIFEWNPTDLTDGIDGTITTQYDFNQANGGGASPSGSLIESGGKFYGTTVGGGAGAYGSTIFEWDPITKTITKQYDFDRNEDGTMKDGYGPYGSLLESGGKFYGTTQNGGADNVGTIFEWDPTDGINGTITKQFDFNSTDGAYPLGSLILSGGKFYGTTATGGADDAGTIFEWDPTDGINGTITKQFDFNTTNGAGPKGSLILSGGKFYGITSTGGADNAGTIFEWDPTDGINGTITKQFDFNSTDGGYPEGSLIESGDKFYGMTNDGGLYNTGVIFEWDPELDGTYTDLHDFGTTTTGETVAVFPETESATITPVTHHSHVTGSSSGAIARFQAEQQVQPIPPVTPATPVIIPTPSTTPTPLNLTRTLKLNILGDDVKELQKYLNDHGFPVALTGPGSKGHETTKFGPLTKKAVIVFQKANNLIPDGIVGPLTLAKMK